MTDHHTVHTTPRAQYAQQTMPIPVHHIMLIDDEDDYHLVTKLALKRAGFAGRLSTFLDTGAALAFLQGSDLPDLLLVDLNMPGVTGFEFVGQCETLGILQHSTTVIMCSSSNRPVDMREADRHPAIHGYVEKAIDTEKFEHMCALHMERLRPH